MNILLWLNMFLMLLTGSAYASFGVQDAVTDLTSPQLSRSAPWGNWSYCPKFTYLNAIKAQRNTLELITGLEFTCSDSDSNSTFHSDLKSRQSSSTLSCGPGRRVVGFQIESTPSDDSDPNNSLVKPGIFSLAMFCLNSSRSISVRKELIFLPSKWMKPLLCAKNEYVCAVRTQKLKNGQGAGLVTNVEMRCCLGEEDDGFGVIGNDNKHAVGKVISSSIYTDAELVRLTNYFTTEQFDSPYWLSWKFCPTNTYVVGVQLGQVGRVLRLLCASAEKVEQMSTVDVSLNDNEVYSKKSLCTGFMVGFQIELDPLAGITNLRLFCSEMDKRAYVDQVGFTGGPGPKFVQRPRLCERNQAVCGMKLIHDASASANNRKLLDIKLKCCNVPDVSDICQPSDELQLIVECDATNAMSDITCTYTKRIGFSVSNTLSASERIEKDLKESLSSDRSITTGTSSGYTSGRTDTEGMSSSMGENWSNTRGKNSGSSNTVTAGKTQGSSDSKTNSKTITGSRSDSLSNSQSQVSGVVSIVGKDESRGNVLTDSTNYVQGSLSTESVGMSRGQTHGTSDSYGSSNSVQSGTSSRAGSSATNSRSNSNSQTDRESRSESEGSSDTDSKSSSMTHGWAVGYTVEAEASFNIGIAAARLKTSLSLSGHGSYSSGSESSNTQTRQSSRDTGRDRSRSESNDVSRSTNTENSAHQSQSSGVSHDQQEQTGNSRTSSVDRTSQNSAQRGGDSSHQRNSQTTEHKSNQNSNTNTRERGHVGTRQDGHEIAMQDVRGRSVELSAQNTRGGTVDISSGKSRGGSTGSGRSNEVRLNRESTGSRNDQHGRSSSTGTTTGFTSGYDWSKSTTETFSTETMVQVELRVPAGMKTKLFQVVGHCSYYSVRASVFRRYDYGRQVHLCVQAFDDLMTCTALLRNATGAEMQEMETYRYEHEDY